MEAIGAHFFGQRLGQLETAQRLVLPLPQLDDPAEAWTELDAGVTERVVELIDRGRHGQARAYGRQRLRRRRTSVCSRPQHGGGMEAPAIRLSRPARFPAERLESSRSVAVGGDDHLHRAAPLRRQHQRLRYRDVLDDVRPGPEGVGGRRQSQFQIGRRRHDHGPVDAVIGQERSRRRLEMRFEDGALRGGSDAAAQQRVKHGCRPHLRSGLGLGRFRRHPAALALEGIRGQPDLAPRVIPIEPCPVRGRPRQVQLPQGLQHLCPVVAPRPERRQPRCFVA